MSRLTAILKTCLTGTSSSIGTRCPGRFSHEHGILPCIAELNPCAKLASPTHTSALSSKLGCDVNPTMKSHRGASAGLLTSRLMTLAAVCVHGVSRLVAASGQRSSGARGGVLESAQVALARVRVALRVVGVTSLGLASSRLRSLTRFVRSSFWRLRAHRGSAMTSITMDYFTQAY